MTQKHYVQVARAMARRMEAADRFTPQTRDLLRGELLDLVSDLADVFAADNPRFDRQRFVTACVAVV